VKFGAKLGGRRAALKPDAEAIRVLAGLLAETGLTEIEYAIGDRRIRVAREPAGTPAAPQNGHAPSPAAATATAATAEAPAAAPAANGTRHPGTLTSPIVGVAYLAPEPGAAPFVRVGDAVNQGQTLLIIEAMKVMNQIRAAHAGRVTQIFIEDAEPVEYGAPLMLIE
jgi:acetyl-CoA carboxylase biotin carboxyl carrier protein